MDRVDQFIASLYQLAASGDTETFRESALRALGRILSYDGVLWGSGNYSSSVFHSVVTLGMAGGYPEALEKTQSINPMLPALLSRVGHAIDMRSVVDDRAFHDSEIYRRCFSRYGIERVLSYLDYDPRSRIYTLISLYRFHADHAFTEAERRVFERAAFHLLAAARHAFLVHVAMDNGGVADHVSHAAVCDDHGLLYQTQPAFLDLVEDVFGALTYPRLPFALPAPGQCVVVRDLCVEAERLGDLFCVRIWRQRPIDRLQGRDRAIVDGVCRGMTFKDIGRELHLAPSTVSNRLYHVYRELGVANRSSLARLVHGSN